MSAGSNPDDNNVVVVQQGSGCLKVFSIVTLVMLAVMLLFGVLAWNAVGAFFDGIGQGITGLGESIGGTIGQGFESLGNTVSGISQGITGLGEAIDQRFESLGNTISEISQEFRDLGESIAALPEKVTIAVNEALETEMRARIETKVELADSINAMGMLVTASHSGDADVNESIRNGLFNLCGVSVRHDAKGTVEAGVELSQVSGSDFAYDSAEDSWTLTLGPARIHSCRIDYIRQYEHSLTLCRQNWDDFRILAEFEAMKQILDEVLAEELIKNAQIVASQVLSNFVSAVTRNENVTIGFDPVGSETKFPKSCEREIPPGWTFDEESDSWLKEK